MAKVVIGAEVKIDGLDQAGKSVGTLKSQLREATHELTAMADKFGVTSKEAQNAAKKVASLRDSIGDAKALADTFNPDKKFVALGSAIQGVTSGFSAYTGAMGLLGGKSEEVEKVLLKVQSAMALQQGISGIAGALDGFKLLANTVKGSVVKAFSTLKGAIIGTGIGALVIAVGLLVANFDEVKKAVLNLIPGLAKVGDFLGSIVDAITDFIGATSDASRATDKLIKDTEQSIKEGQAFLDANGDKYDEYTQRKIRAVLEYKKQIIEVNKDEALSEGEKLGLIQAYKEKADREVARSDSDRAAAADKVREDQAEKEKAAAEKAKALREKQEKEKEDAFEKEKKRLDDIAKFKREQNEKEQAEVEAFGAALNEEADAKAAAEVQRLYDNNEAMLQAKADIAEQNLLNDPDSIENKLAKSEADFQLEMAQFEGSNIERQNAAIRHKDALVQIEKEGVDAKKALHDIEVEHQNQLVDGIANALDTLADIAGKQTTAGKVLSIAVTTINTIKGAISAFTGMTQQIPGPVGIALGAVAAAGVVASGVKAVKQIVAVKIPRGGGAGSGSAPSVSLPAAPIKPSAETTKLDQGSINSIGSAASRAYVVESDVSGNQERIRRLNRAARIN